MFSDEEIKESSLMRPGDEIISIREVCLIDKYDKKYFEPSNSNPSFGRNDLEAPRLFRDGFFPEGAEQASFAWTEEDGIASLISEPGFGTTGQTSFGKDLDAALRKEMKEADRISVPESKNGLTFERKPCVEPDLVSSTSAEGPSSSSPNHSKGRVVCKVDKSDPRSRLHYVKYVKRHGRTVKLWDCGICGREFQHQYTLMRHLPTHTDERNFHCDTCTKSFRQLSTLSQHRAIHSAARPYACEVCNKTFNRVSTLISHRKTHSEEKPYKCHICPKGFHQKGNLRNHLFTHTNERPYRCNICMRGFNQQSNLVCHKNKAHPEENSTTTNVGRNRTGPRVATQPAAETKAESSRMQSEQCEVTSSVGPYLLPSEAQSFQPQWEIKPEQAWSEGPWGSNGVIVDAIKTYHMGVALATRQTPFALLKSDNGAAVLVKIVDAKLPGGKQMLVPATAEDLRIGGKIILGSEENSNEPQVIDVESTPDNGAVQIRVPVVATVIPKVKPGGRLQLSVEEPHYEYHTDMSSDVAGALPCLEPLQRAEDTGFDEQNLRSGDHLCAPSPPLDFISLDLFEPMGCIPLGPQITTVDSIDQSPPSDDSDIFIGNFEESIPLSDSD
ncbi:zinc finger protein 205-like isoform X2 [Maniola jurtina]|uniref:zinc finger protein 205-like isoform X2 n=1 Tax=Maniola jurtina TaxID=191418 RepID=UPI001E6887C9|nr:zinc finger protein 205-like isoform X2 [Maniola jurtina]